MAFGSGIIQWIRLRLDKAATQQATEQAKAAGREIGGGVAEGVSRGSQQARDAMGRFIKQGANEAEREVAQSTSRMGRMFSGLGASIRNTFSGIGGLLAGYFAVGQIRDFVSHMWQLGTAAEETQSKFNTTFGREGAAQVQSFIDQFGTLMGLNRTMAQEMTATGGAIVQGMGASREASAQFATQMVKLAGDLQSFHNVPIADTFRAIRSGMTGEFESLKTLGIVLRQTEIDQRALSQTNKASEKDLTQLERATAAYSLMVERAGPALGDLERTQDSTANRARNLKAEYENLKIELATGLLPVFASVIDYLHTNRERLGENARAAGAFARILVGVLAAAFNTVGSLIAGSFMTALGAARTLLASVAFTINTVVESLAEMGNRIGVVSDATVAAARARTAASRQNIRQGGREWREGWREQWQAINGQRAAEGYFGAQEMLTPARGNFTWQDQPQNRPATTPPNAQDAEKERVQALTDEVRLLQEMAERRADFPELTARAVDVERRLNAELQAGTADTGRRVQLLDQIDKVRDIIAEKDAASLRAIRDAERAEEERQRTLSQQVDTLEDALEFRGAVPDLLERSRALEAQLQAEADNVNTSLERRLELLDQINRVRAVGDAVDPAAQAERDRLAGTWSEDNPLVNQDVDEILSYWGGVADALEDIAMGWADAWQDAFELILIDGGNAAQALQQLGKSMGASILGALSNLARGKVKANVAEAIEQLGYAFSAFAWGNAASGSKHMAAAAKHGLAAAAWGVLAGAAGAGAGAIGGAGGSSTGSGGRNGGRNADDAANREPETHVYVRVVNNIDPLDPNRPAVQDFIVRGARLGLVRHGPDALTD